MNETGPRIAISRSTATALCRQNSASQYRRLMLWNTSNPEM